MKAKKKHVTKRMANERKMTTENEEAETKAIEKWLRMVDKPLGKKEGEKKDAEPRDGENDKQIVATHGG